MNEDALPDLLDRFHSGPTAVAAGHILLLAARCDQPLRKAIVSYVSERILAERISTPHLREAIEHMGVEAVSPLQAASALLSSEASSPDPKENRQRIGATVVDLICTQKPTRHILRRSGRRLSPLQIGVLIRRAPNDPWSARCLRGKLWTLRGHLRTKSLAPLRDHPWLERQIRSCPVAITRPSLVERSLRAIRHPVGGAFVTVGLLLIFATLAFLSRDSAPPALPAPPPAAPTKDHQAVLSELRQALSDWCQKQGAGYFEHREAILLPTALPVGWISFVGQPLADTPCVVRPPEYVREMLGVDVVPSGISWMYGDRYFRSGSLAVQIDLDDERRPRLQIVEPLASRVLLALLGTLEDGRVLEKLETQRPSTREYLQQAAACLKSVAGAVGREVWPARIEVAIRLVSMARATKPLMVREADLARLSELVEGHQGMESAAALGAIEATLKAAGEASDSAAPASPPSPLSESVSIGVGQPGG